MGDQARRLDLLSQRDVAKKVDLVRTAGAAWAGQDEDHQGADCCRDLLFQVKGHGCQLAWGAKVGRHVAEQLYLDAPAQQRWLEVALLRQGEQLLADAPNLRNQEQPGAQPQLASRHEPADGLV